MIDQLVLQTLVTNEEYSRKVIPFLNEDYFSSRADKNLFNITKSFIETYKGLPTKTALEIELDKTQLTSEEIADLKQSIDSFFDNKESQDLDWLVDETEKFCQDKAIFNAITTSIKILDGSAKESKGAIPEILSSALGVSFDSHVGHDFLEDYEKRFEFYHKRERRIPFDLDYFNKITKGGIPPKTLNVIIAGCVHPDTKIKVRFKKSTSNKEIKIRDISRLLEEGYEIEVDSPDGFVPVLSYVDKGEWEEYLLTSKRGDVRCNENHLFETSEGWKYAKDMLEGKWWVLTENNYWIMATIHKTNKKIPIVDIQVDHPNHRYYTNGISSHNTNVGKSLFMCHAAAANISKGYNVLYITLEMSQEEISKRIDQNLLNISTDDLMLLPKDLYTKKMERLKSNVKGKLIVKEYPTASAGASHFRHLLNELKIKKNFKPSIIYVDYLNICVSSRLKFGGAINSYSYVKAIAEELRGLAVECDVPIFTATQTNRTGFTSSDIGLEDTSESFGLPQTADFMIALISSEELQDLGQFMVKQLKNRYSDPSMNRRFVIGVDRSKMKLYDVEQAAQDNIVDDAPIFDSTETGKRMKSERKFNKVAFEGFS